MVASIVAKVAAQMAILCIEDCQDILDNLCEMLTLEGYHAIPANDGKLGVQIAILEAPELIICGIQLPSMDGYQVLRVIRAFSRTRRIPFMFLSTNTMRSSILRAILLGADYYLGKPYSMAELLDIIRRHERLFSQD